MEQRRMDEVATVRSRFLDKDLGGIGYENLLGM